MAVFETGIIDFISHQPATNEVALTMVEHREWGERGALLPDLQAKLNTYLTYILDGQLAADYPDFKDTPLHISLRAMHPPSARELQFLDLVASTELKPRGIRFSWQLITSPANDRNASQLT